MLWCCGVLVVQCCFRYVMIYFCLLISQFNSIHDISAVLYSEAVRPGGILAEYLRLGSLALLLGGRGDGCLFVHGGLHPHTLG